MVLSHFDANNITVGQLFKIFREGVNYIKPFPSFQYLDCLWAQIKNLQSHKWMENQINRPYLAFDSVLSEALQHTLPQIIPPAHDEDSQYPLPSVVYRMFDYTDVPEVVIQALCSPSRLFIRRITKGPVVMSEDFG